jgi:hypothetical protein
MSYEGYDAMYTGKPSKPGKTQVQIGYGVVAGDGVGYTDNGDLMTTRKVDKGVVGGGQRDYNEESTKTIAPEKTRTPGKK